MFPQCQRNCTSSQFPLLTKLKLRTKVITSLQLIIKLVNVIKFYNFNNSDKQQNEWRQSNCREV